MGAWIETSSTKKLDPSSMSHPYMGAWIETTISSGIFWPSTVAPLHGCVDWNGSNCLIDSSCMVAPLHGCVDWNIWNRSIDQIQHRRTLTWVRGLKQSWHTNMQRKGKSHPYMGAWIETQNYNPSEQLYDSRTLTWVRGLKRRIWHGYGQIRGRTLTWVRGLKHGASYVRRYFMPVAPLHGCVDWNTLNLM